MRTKVLLGLAVLAVSAATCVAQSSNVYSLNIVGYVNVDVQAGLNLVSNPLKPSNGNYNITNTIVLPDVLQDTELYKWVGAGWSTDVPVWFAGGIGWFSSTPMNILLGESFFLKAPATTPAGTKVTFVGEVQTGAVDYSIPPGTSVIAPKIPVAESFPGADIGHDGDQIFTWKGAAWGNPWVWVPSYGWFGPLANDPVAGPVVAVGGGVVYQNIGAALNWTRQFNPQ
jgi:hypothetical protein